MERASAELLIVSKDEALIEVFGKKLRQWGVTVYQHEQADYADQTRQTVNVVLVDVRHQAEKIIAGLCDIRKSLPWASRDHRARR